MHLRNQMFMSTYCVCRNVECIQNVCVSVCVCVVLCLCTYYIVFEQVHVFKYDLTVM